jgi:alpha-N-arabinofuranosidase
MNLRPFLPLMATQVLLSLTAADAAEPPSSLSIEVNRPVAQVSPLHHGLMTEEINHSYDGGLYAELVQNRAFLDNEKNPDHWFPLQGAGASVAMEIDKTQFLTSALPNSLKVEVSSASLQTPAGVANEGYWGIPVKPQTRYRASFYAKAAPGFTGPLTISLQSSDGKTIYARHVVNRLSTDWKQFQFTLETGKVAPTSAAKLAITATRPGKFWLNLVSLFPPTWKNRTNGLRPDLMQMMIDLKPKFLRFPGGNYLEGNTIAERFNWKKTLGPLSQRPGHQAPWGYRSTDGMGLMEFLLWAEDVGAQPLLGVYAGYSLRGDYIKPGPDLLPYIQEALDEIEYVMGPTSSPWGAKRARDGHPRPFPLRYVEIGNEDFFDKSGSYDARFAQFYDAIKAKYPQLKLISSVGFEQPREKRVQSRLPDVVDEHYYRSTAEFLRMEPNHYERYQRIAPEIFVGEWAAFEDVVPWSAASNALPPTPSMKAALGDAAFMASMERNSDLVKMQCYAPLLVNVNPGGRQWRPNLIGYDALRAFGSPSYYAIRMFSNNLGDTILRPDLKGTQFPVSVTLDKSSSTLFLKMVNPKPEAQQLQVHLAGTRAVEPLATSTVLASDPSATNSLALPTAVLPVTRQVNGIGPDFPWILPPNSITVLKFKVKSLPALATSPMPNLTPQATAPNAPTPISAQSTLPTVSAANNVAPVSSQANPAPLKDAFKGKFLIGTALSNEVIQNRLERETVLAMRHFDAFTPENALKPDATQPREGEFDFTRGDRLVELAEKAGATPIGHTLVWHSQTPRWFFEGPGGQPLNRELALARLRNHIKTVVGHYKGRVKQWDVVNEALNDGPGLLRPSPWFRAIGEDYIAEAFRAAHEADPDAVLVYNDYNIELNYKRPKALELLKKLIAQKVPINAVGIQCHWRIDNPPLAEMETAIQEFSALGLKVMVTELDMGVLPTKYQGADISMREAMTPEQAAVVNPFTAGLPDDVAQKQAERYRQAFELFLRYKDAIGRVTLWGVEDGNSWLNNFPIRDRTEYALLFNRQGQAKPAFFAVQKLAAVTEPKAPAVVGVSDSIPPVPTIPDARPIAPRPINLEPGDKPAFPPAPVGFDALRQDIAHGTTALVEYPSTTVGVTRKMQVYTPPGYTPEKKYPVLYLLHGIGGDENEWKNNGAPAAILDNLYAANKLTPMIVVMPNGRAQKDDRPIGNVYAAAPAFENFEGDLLKDVIPFVEANYSVQTGAQNRALAGLSMGGGQSLNFGLAHLDTFAWVGGFSSAPNTRSPQQLLPDPDAAKKQLKLLWVSVGDRDGLFFISQRTHQYLAQHSVPHIWHVEPGGHDFGVWKQDLYNFSQLLFR